MYAIRRALKKAPEVLALHDVVVQHKPVQAYLQSLRRIPFNEDSLLRRDPELDA